MMFVFSVLVELLIVCSAAATLFLERGAVLLAEVWDGVASRRISCENFWTDLILESPRAPQ